MKLTTRGRPAARLLSCLALSVLAVAPSAACTRKGAGSSAAPASGSVAAPAPPGAPVASAASVPPKPTEEQKAAAEATGIPAALRKAGWAVTREEARRNGLVPCGVLATFSVAHPKKGTGTVALLDLSGRSAPNITCSSRVGKERAVVVGVSAGAGVDDVAALTAILAQKPVDALTGARAAAALKGLGFKVGKPEALETSVPDTTASRAAGGREKGAAVAVVFDYSEAAAGPSAASIGTDRVLVASAADAALSADLLAAARPAEAPSTR